MRRPLKGAGAPLFLPRPEYRRRRLVDAARLLPVFGFFLLLLPTLWAPAVPQANDMASDGIYLFGVWAVLVGGAAWLARGLASPSASGLGEDGEYGADLGDDSGSRTGPEDDR